MVINSKCTSIIPGLCKVIAFLGRSLPSLDWCRLLQFCECFVSCYLNLILLDHVWDFLETKKCICYFKFYDPFKSRDLSCNMLSGKIPSILGNLTYTEKLLVPQHLNLKAIWIILCFLNFVLDWCTVSSFYIAGICMGTSYLVPFLQSLEIWQSSTTCMNAFYQYFLFGFVLFILPRPFQMNA